MAERSGGVPPQLGGVADDLRRAYLASPSDDLARRQLDAMLEAVATAVVPITARTRRLPHLGAAALAAGLGVAMLGGGAAAAATGSLPDPVQDFVASVVEPVGIDVPHAHEDNPGRADDAPGRGGENPGRSDGAPGHEDNPGRADEAPGRGGENPGRSEQAPGHGGVIPADPAPSGPPASTPGNPDTGPPASTPGSTPDPGPPASTPGQGGGQPGPPASTPGNVPDTGPPSGKGPSGDPAGKSK